MQSPAYRTGNTAVQRARRSLLAGSRLKPVKVGRVHDSYSVELPKVSHGFMCRAEAFKQHFERFGKVLEGQIMVDHTSGRSRGFG